MGLCCYLRAGRTRDGIAGIPPPRSLDEPPMAPNHCSRGVIHLFLSGALQGVAGEVEEDGEVEEEVPWVPPPPPLQHKLHLT